MEKTIAVTAHSFPLHLPIFAQSIHYLFNSRYSRQYYLLWAGINRFGQVSDKYNEATGVVAKARERRAVIAGIGFGGSQIALFLTYALLFWCVSPRNTVLLSINIMWWF
jgi:hypothetical protein